MFWRYLQFTEPRNGVLGLGCAGTGSLMANYVGQQNLEGRGGVTFLGSLATKLRIVTEPSHLVSNPS